MFCEKCGHEIEEGAKFCENCGAPVGETVTKPADTLAETEETILPVIELPEDPVQENTGYTDWQQTPQTPPVSEKKPVNKGVIIFIAEIAAVVAGFVAAFMIANILLSPKHVAENYFIYLANDDTENAFKLLDLEEDDFLNPTAFNNLLAVDRELVNVKSYRVEEAAPDENDPNTKIVNIIYTMENGDETTANIALKNVGKKYLLFNDWRVVSDDMTVVNYSIETLPDAKLFIDDVLVSADKYQTPTEDGNVTYIIPKLFKGQHAVKVSKDGYTDLETTIVSAFDMQFANFTYMLFSAESVNDMQTAAAQSIMAIYQAALAQRPYDEVKGYIIESEQDTEEDNYDSLLYYFDAMTTHVNKVDFRGVHSEAYDDGSLTLYFDYVVYYTTAYGREREQNGSGYAYVYMIKDGDQWKLDRLGANDLCYLPLFF
ncbi:MAG: zinc-ribbon domain-containing protein [Lachnospiraceae bacterium]|nr:zinc-ribbon domain-containing protein [Lachnospiraceae bacterium]